MIQNETNRKECKRKKKGRKREEKRGKNTQEQWDNILWLNMHVTGSPKQTGAEGGIRPV